MVVCVCAGTEHESIPNHIGEGATKGEWIQY